MKKEIALLFDFDGTVINSQPVINEYIEHIFAHKHIEVTNDEKKKMGGMSFPMMREYLLKNRGIKFTKLERSIYNVWFILRHLKDIKQFPHTFELLDNLKEQGYKLGIVTNSPRNYLNYISKKEKIKHFFATTVSVTESKAPKPDPAMMVMASHKLGIPYENCVVIDDNEPGILAGKALGMKTVRLAEKKVNSEADFVIGHVTDLPKILKGVS